MYGCGYDPKSELAYNHHALVLKDLAISSSRSSLEIDFGEGCAPACGGYSLLGSR